MPSTRKRILDYLTAHRAASAATLASAMQMTASNARYHLARLEDEGLIEPTGEPLSDGPGRPARTYRLVRRDHNLDRLASALLQTLTMDRSQADLENTLKSVVEHLEGATTLTAGRLAQKLVLAIGRLNRLNYQARWEAHAQAPQITLGHCPYTDIIEAHPELCVMDAQLIQSMIDQPVNQTAKLERDQSGRRFCRFIVRQT